jgi:hypothetical protein
MPNWVYNHVVITGPKATLEHFYRERLSFQKLHPRPTELDDHWYEWNVANWGTKWEPEESCPLLLEDRLVITLETAWTPPTEFLCHLSEFYEGVKVTNKFIDESWIFVGISNISDGVADTMVLEPCDFTFAALAEFSKTHDWYNHNKFINMIHLLNDCDGDSGCKCLDVDQSHLLSDVKTSKSIQSVVSD